MAHSPALHTHGSPQAVSDCTEHAAWLRDMLVDKWDLEPPRIMLAVTGGAQSFELPPKLDDMIRIGLRKAAESESMWITSGRSPTSQHSSAFS
jgi:hypothetical protein